MDFNYRLKKRREYKNISREELANIIGLSYSTVSKYESGLREPDLKTIGKIAIALEVSIDYLIGISENPNLLDKDEVNFIEAITDPDLKRWFKGLPISEEEDLKKLRKMWELIKDDPER